jgi:type II secretory pathway component PulF
MKLIDTILSLGGSTVSQRAACARHLSALLSSGIALPEALDLVASVSPYVLRATLHSVSQSIASGNTLSEALERYPRHFPPLFIAMVKSGEASGTLSKNLSYVAVQLEKERQFVSKVRSAMMYPSLVLGATGLMGLGMVYFILPKILPLFRGLKVELPMSTKVLLWIADVVNTHGTLLTLGIFVGLPLFWFIFSRKFFAPFRHAVLLRIPLFGSLAQDTLLTRMSFTLGTLLQSGLHIDEALTVTEGMINHTQYRRVLNTAVSRVRSGGTLSDVFAQHPHLFPPLMVSMVSVAQESGELMETFTSIGVMYEQEADMRMKTITTLIEPVLLLIIGSVVGWLALSIISPIYGITGNIRR